MTQDPSVEQPVSFSVNKVLEVGEEFIVASARGLHQLFLCVPAFQSSLFPWERWLRPSPDSSRCRRAEKV